MIANKFSASTHYLAEIDGLRAIAILSVFLFHANLGVPSGFVGVDVFFVISGYLITKILAEEWQQRGKIDLFRFFARRFRRLFPAVVTLVAITLPLSALFLSPHGEFKEAAASAASGITYVANFFFHLKTIDYFGPETDHMPFLHLWSLAVEEQFYLFWPLILPIFLRRKKVVQIGLMIGVIFASLAFAEYWVHRSPQVAFFQMPSRFWELTAGSIIAVSAQRPFKYGAVVAISGLSLILISCMWTIKSFPGINAIPAVLGTALVLHCLHNRCELGTVGRILSLRPFVYIGLISYSLYLWHWPLFALLRVSTADEPSIVLRGLTCLIAICAAALSYRYVERPIRSMPLTASPKAIVTAGLMASLAVAACSMSVGKLLDHPAPPNDFASMVSRDQPDNRFTCHLRFDQTATPKPSNSCIRGENRPRSLVIWGDSMAFAWQPFAWRLADEVDATTTSYSKDACAPVVGHKNGLNRNFEKLCEDFNAKTITNMPRTDILILAARWRSVFENDSRTSRQENLEGMLKDTISAAMQISEQLYILGPTPRLNDAVPRCLRLDAVEKCAVSRRDFENNTAYVRTLLKGIADQNNKIRYIEPIDFFCNLESCPAIKDDVALYWDSFHVTQTAASAFYDFYRNLSTPFLKQSPGLPDASRIFHAND